MAPSDPERRLLRVIQERVPLVREPFAALGAEFGCDQRWVMDRIAALRGRGGLIREISGVFDAAALGYEQSLLALRVSPDRLEDAARLVARHPGVSHCYGRTGPVNLWLTLAVSPRSRFGLEKTARLLAALAGAGEAMVLPTLRRYKLRVRFDPDAPDAVPLAPAEPGRPADEDAPEPRPAARGATSRGAPDLADEQIRAVRALQADLPARPDPFAVPAAAQGLEPDMLLVHAADFLAAGWLRRYAAVLRHRAAGARANVLVAWAVAGSAADAAGARCARFAAVSHCYLRPTAPGWPYNLYTMIHGRSDQDCRLIVDEIAATAGLGEQIELWTTAEFKKRRVPLFTEDEAAWEDRHDD